MKKKNSPTTEEHHRRPVSLGGSDSPSNKSYVPCKLHKHWHTLFGNMNARQICHEINNSFAPDGITVTCVFINGKEVVGSGEHNSKNKNKRLRAWMALSKGLDFKETLSYFNNVWLDPSYRLYC
jgi:hypothetical protein